MHIASHSLRKGASTYAIGIPNGPNPVSVYLRMGHSLGNLKDRYIFQTEGADQLCGRILSGLPFHNELFGSLCPHFTTDIQNNLTDTFWENVVPEYQFYPDNFKSCMPMLLASLIFHENFLREHLPDSFFNIRVFAANDYLQVLRGNVRTGLNYCADTKLKATGVPSHLLMVIKMHSMQDSLETLEKSFVSQMELDSKRREAFITEFPSICSRELGEYLKQNFFVDSIFHLNNLLTNKIPLLHLQVQEIEFSIYRDHNF